jgi:MATE family, multidrug efflux pump
MSPSGQPADKRGDVPAVAASGDSLGIRAHPFDQRPNRTLLWLSAPVLLSLIAEPLTALVDTAFISRLGATAQAALGVGTTLLSGSFWIFNFLSVGTQSEVARLHGSGELDRAREMNGLALVLAASFGLAMLIFGWVAAAPLSSMMGTTAATQGDAIDYLRIRLLAAPAVLITATAFGSLRGLQRMRIPMVIAILVNVFNIGLDALLIFGWGSIPAMGISGAAWASMISQWIGAGFALWAVLAALGMPRRWGFAGAGSLLRIGGDMFVRTGLLTMFLILGTRAATRIGDEAGAAHHAIRQVWLFTALLLDAFAVTAQSLVAWYLGADRKSGARRVAAYCCGWSLITGMVLAVVMILGQSAVARALVPTEAHAVFATAWIWGALAQPLNGLCFATDGLHWGTRDFRYLRNAMICATLFGVAGLSLVDPTTPQALVLLWQVTAGWVLVRAAAGLLRIWPGIGNAPLGRRPMS